MDTEVKMSIWIKFHSKLFLSFYTVLEEEEDIVVVSTFNGKTLIC